MNLFYKLHSTQQDIGLHEGQHKPALQPIAIDWVPRHPHPSLFPLVSPACDFTPHKSRVCRAAVI